MVTVKYVAYGDCEVCGMIGGYCTSMVVWLLLMLLMWLAITTATQAGWHSIGDCTTLHVPATVGMLTHALLLCRSRTSRPLRCVS